MDTQTGEVMRVARKGATARDALKAVAGMTDRPIVQALKELERRRLVRRAGRPYGTRIYVVAPAFFARDKKARCERCLGPRAAASLCDRCRVYQVQISDEWRAKALELAVMGVGPAAITVRLKVPLFGSPDDDEATVQKGYVVPWLYRHGLLSAEWEEMWKRRKTGAV
jgi:hypothetical protein